MKLPTKVALLFLILGGIASVIISGFIYFSLRQKTIEAFNQRQSILASQNLLAVDRLLYERYLDIKEMASGELRDAFIDDGDDLDLLAIEERLLDLNKSSGPWDLVSIIDDQTKVLVSTESDLEETSIDVDNPNFEAYQAALTGEIYYSDAVISKETGRITVIFATLLEKKAWSNYPTLVLLAQFSLPAATEILNIPVSTSYLFNKHGELINTTDPENQDKEFLFNLNDDLKQKIDLSIEPHESSGFFSEEKSFHTSVKEKGYLHYKGNDWTLVLETPEKVVLQEVGGVVISSLIIMVPITMLMVFISMVVFMKSIVVPIKDLTNYIEKITNEKLNLNDLDLGDFQIDRADEIGTLRREFGQMIARVRSSTNQVVEQVEIAEKARAHLAASITNLPLGFILVDDQGEIELANKAVKKIFSFKDFPSNFSQIESLLFKNSNLGKTIKRSRKTKKSYLMKELKLGLDRYLRVFIVPVILDKNNAGAIDNVVLFEDITEELLLSRTRDEFFAVASHELRTPLTSLRGNASLLMEHFKDKLKNKDIKSMIEDIHKSSIRLISIVEDFLDVSRIDQKQIKYYLESFDILALIEDSINELENLAAEKSLPLSFIEKPPGPLLVKADKNRTKQIIVNLLSNAIKFTNKGAIEVRVFTEQDKIGVSVTDSGIGIAPENQKMLFRKFMQTGSNHLTRNATQGTGLGLYISKMLVQGMGGKIALESSEPGKGSTFTFSLPVSTAPEYIENKIEKKV